jgi:hypothetical protein
MDSNKKLAGLPPKKKLSKLHMDSRNPVLYPPPWVPVESARLPWNVGISFGICWNGRNFEFQWILPDSEWNFNGFHWILSNISMDLQLLWKVRPYATSKFHTKLIFEHRYCIDNYLHNYIQKISKGGVVWCGVIWRGEGVV